MQKVDFEITTGVSIEFIPGESRSAMLERAHARMVELSKSVGELELSPLQGFNDESGEYSPVKEADEPIPVKMVCAHCGSTDLRRNSDLIWNIIEQKWEIMDVFDNTDCEDCGGECSVKQVNLTEEEYVNLGA